MARPKNSFASGRARLLCFLKQEKNVSLSDTEISTSLDLSMRSVQRYLADFAKQGFVEVKRKRHKSLDYKWHNCRTISFKD